MKSQRIDKAPGGQLALTADPVHSSKMRKHERVCGINFVIAFTLISGVGPKPERKKNNCPQ